MSGTTPTTDDLPLRAIDLPATDDLLRDDVRRLGALVGEILADQVSPRFLQEVEQLRVAAIGRRESGGAVDALAARLRNLDQDHAEQLVRAFLSYFQAVNLAERVHRIRRRRDYQRQGDAPQPGGLEAVLLQLRDAGVSAQEVCELLARMRIEPIFTAHPTEAQRRALLEKEQTIVQRLVDDIDRSLTPQERRAGIGRIRQAMGTAWQTDETPPEKPTVADEFEHVSFYLTEVLFRVLPVFFEDFAEALETVYGADGLVEVPSAVLGFGSWVGGDMDGNPNVGAHTIRDTLAAQRRQVLRAYRRDLDKLAGLLSQSVTRTGFDADLLARLEDYRARFPEAAATIKPRHADMPYRSFLVLVAARLEATRNDEADGYADASGFLDDIRLLDRSLLAHRGEEAGHFSVRRLIRRIEVFGFHLATLDLRQDSAIHEAALAELFDDADWPDREADTRAERLRAWLRQDGGRTACDPEQEAAHRTLQVFEAVRELRPRYGANAFGPYIVSMSRSAADALAVLVLARMAGLVDDDDQVPLDVAPLFETVDDLAAAADVLRSLFDDPAYRTHLRARGDRQVVMLGYSDSAKDGGIVASRWGLQQTQIALSELARESGVRIAFFHGRGGSLSRGGGKTERAVIAAPRGTVDGFLRLTEQGEVIHRKYGIRALALRNLEQTTGAVLRATLRPRPPEPREARWRAIAEEVAAHSREVYRGLVYGRDDFIPYFRQATPIDVIERLRIGSRPSKRGSAGGVTSLRAIPWVFAWSQNRAGLTAWYGVGSGLARAIERHGLETLAEMARDWAFFATLVDDVEMVLAKSDMAIFEAYSRLADGHAVLYPEIRAEFERTREAILAIKGAEDLLEGDRRLRVSIRLRNPYVDPISLLQVDLLKRWRAAGSPEDDGLFHALVATVNGIAAGIQNTG